MTTDDEFQRQDALQAVVGAVHNVADDGVPSAG